MEAIARREAVVLARLANGIFLRRDVDLSDGSYLTTLSRQPPSRTQSHSDGTNPEVKKRHRLITTLLDPVLAPALDLCLLYHERWEIELCIDEMKNHLRLSQHPLRSHLPLLALQEAYAMLLTQYAVRWLMFQAAQSQPGLDVDRLSLTICVQSVRDALILSPQIRVHLQPTMFCQLSASLVEPASLLEPRRLRFNCRVVKRIATRFRRKGSEHQNLHLKNASFADILLM